MYRFPFASSCFVPAITCAALALAAPAAHAVAQMGGTLSLNMVPGSGSCNVTRQVPLTTLQDSFSLSAATPVCSGQSLQGALRADAATASVGLSLSASGPQTGGAAQVGFIDRWTITPPPGTPAGFITLPVSFSLEGVVAAGSQFPSSFGRFMDYAFTISDPNSGAGNPLQFFQSLGRITATGTTILTFNGNVSFRNFNQPQLPMTALVEMSLLVPQLDLGAIDFYNTATVSLSLPAGFTATNSSGVTLPFSSPVPEPATTGLWLLGLAAVGGRCRRKLRASAYGAGTTSCRESSCGLRTTGRDRTP